MTHEFIPMAKPRMWGDEKKNVLSAVNNGWISSKGAFVDEFEKEFASTVNRKFAIAVSNGTAALHLALLSLNIKPGDEIIVPTFTMMAVAFAAKYVRAVLIPVDCDSSWNIDPNKIEERINAKTRAIICVHTYGNPVNMWAIKKICIRNNVKIIEDGAEALGSNFSTTNVGAFGDISCFSFYANKIITTGEGGIIVTNSKKTAEKIKSYRNMCFGKNLSDQYIHSAVGYNYRLTNLQAAIGVAQLPFLNSLVIKYKKNAQLYYERLKEISNIDIQQVDDRASSIYWVVGIVLCEPLLKKRDLLQKFLFNNKIDSRRFFEPLHKQPFYKNSNKITFPISENISQNGICLPNYYDLSSSSINRICDSIKSFCKSKHI